ncbi:hypothetical protein EC881042_1147A, partial [Escherichia coli 88.1042]
MPPGVFLPPGGIFDRLTGNGWGGAV